MGRLEDLLAKQRHLEDGQPTDGGVPEPIAIIGTALVEQVQDHLDKVDVLQAEIDRCLKSTETENHRLQYDVYQPKIRLLEDERDQLMRANVAVYEKERDQQKQEVEGLYLVVNQVKEILRFLRLEPGHSVDINDDDVTTYRDKYKESLGYIFEDEYLTLKLFIVGNDKPKNKYSLIALGRTIFTDEQLKLRREYGLSLNTKQRCQLEAVLREGPSLKELREWLQKPSQSKLLTDLKGDFDTVKAAYLDTVEQYQVDDFRELLTDLCTCGYFYSIFDSMAFKNGVQTCGRCSNKMEKLK